MPIDRLWPPHVLLSAFIVDITAMEANMDTAQVTRLSDGMEEGGRKEEMSECVGERGLHQEEMIYAPLSCLLYRQSSPINLLLSRSPQAQVCLSRVLYFYLD